MFDEPVWYGVSTTEMGGVFSKNSFGCCQSEMCGHFGKDCPKQEEREIKGLCTFVTCVMNILHILMVGWVVLSRQLPECWLEKGMRLLF
jgi:hypothetical protein